MDRFSEFVAPENNYRNALIVAAILVVIAVVAVIYYAIQRGKMDTLYNDTTEGGGNSLNGISQIVKDSYIVTVTYVMLILLCVAVLTFAYLAYKLGALEEITTGTYILLAGAAAIIYIAIRLLESSFVITPETAGLYPRAVYAAVVSAESLMTAALAIFAFFLALTYIGYSGRGDTFVRAAKPRPALPPAQPLEAPLSSADGAGRAAHEGYMRRVAAQQVSPVPGGYIDLNRAVDLARLSATN